MSTQFKNLTQLSDFFKDEEVCKKYYEKSRWNGKIVCPHCKHEKIYHTNRGYKCAGCLKKFSVITGTIFENTKISLRIWFAALFLITSSKKGISSVQLSLQLGITQKTAWFVLHRIREMLKASESIEMLTGTVQADEKYIYGKFKNKSKSIRKKILQENDGKGVQGRSNVGKIPIVGLIETGGKVRTFVVQNTNSETLHQIIDNNVSDNATIVTDAYKSYNGLSKKFNHIVVKHTDGNYIHKEGAKKFHTQNIESYWAVLSRGYIGIYHYWSSKHVHKYTSEFAYRYNTKELTVVERFDDSLANTKNTRITYQRLIGK
jgi:transposase-like protein